MSTKTKYASMEMRSATLKNQQEQTKSLIDHAQEEKDANDQVAAQSISAQKTFNNVSTFDSVAPIDIIKTAINVGYKKALSTCTLSNKLSILRVFLKSILSGSYLGFGITLTITAISVGYDRVTAALLFAMGFVMLILMGNDLATGNFCLLPMAYLFSSKKKKNHVSIGMIMANWLVVYSGNFAGAMLYLFLLWSGMTHFGALDSAQYEDFEEVLCQGSGAKVVLYKSTGVNGWFAAVCDGILCNWMVTLAVLLSFSSKATIGRIVAMYLPVTMFITLGFEHSIVNLFYLPAGLIYDCNVYHTGEWLWWNQIPVTIGNIIGGVTLTGIIYFVIWAPKL